MLYIVGGMVTAAAVAAAIVRVLAEGTGKGISGLFLCEVRGVVGVLEWVVIITVQGDV
jgi:hypothetical protein